MATWWSRQSGMLGTPVAATSDTGASVRGILPQMQVVGGDGSATPAGSAADPYYTQTGALPAGTDRSGTTNATAGTDQALAAANASRRGLNIQNISAGNIGVNEIGGAASIGSPGTYTVAAGATFNVRTNRAVRIVGSAASQSYTATEF